MADYRLDGTNPLGYMGVRPYTPPQMIVRKRAPTANDVQGLSLGTQWLHYIEATPTESVQYVLVNAAQNVAVWLPLNGGDDNPTLPDHSVALGIGVPGLSSTGPVATGSLFVSNGIAADPSFGVTPNATLGQPVVSNGVGVLPTFGTASVSGGGTGLNVTVPYSVYAGGTTGEGPVQQVAGLGTAGQVLTSNGIGMLPTWQAGGGGGGGNGGPIAVQVFTTPGAGTYTPTAGMGSCIVECIGGGGGGAGSNTAGVSSYIISAGGGSGGYTRKLFLAAAIGASQNFVIGSGGAGGTGAVDGGNADDGTDTTFGAFLTASGGTGPTGGTGHVTTDVGLGGAAAGGDINITGQSGFAGSLAQDGAFYTSVVPLGGNILYGSTGSGEAAVSDAGDTIIDGQDATDYGAGGCGSLNMIGGSGTGGNATGGNGADGIIIITEYGPYAPTPPAAGTEVNIIVLDTPGAGTYTPTAGMTQVQVECVGGGGGASSVNVVGVAQGSGGGGGGGYCKKLFDAATIGASQNYSVGIAGAGGSGVASGNPGGSTTFGAFLTAGGGGASTFPVVGTGGVGGSATGGDFNMPGQNGSYGGNASSALGAWGGLGGGSMYGQGGPGRANGQGGAGLNGSGYGGGGGGSLAITGVVLGPQASGTAGVIIITEYIAA